MKMYKTKKKWKNIISLLCFMTFCYMFIWAPRQIAEKFAEKYCVVKNMIIRSIQRKIPQISDFPKKRDSNPLPHGDNAADIAKMFARYFS
jgi:hypothetical protein